MSTYETVHDSAQSQRTSYGSGHSQVKNLSDGYMRMLDTTVVIAVVVMFLGPLITAAFGPIN